MLPAVDFTVEVIVDKIYAYMNHYGRIISAVEYEEMKNNPKTAWVIATHWSNIVPLKA